MGDVSMSWWLVLILLTLALPQNQLALCVSMEQSSFSFRFEIDQSRLQLNERQLCTHALDPGKGRLVCLVTLRLSWGVSISDCGTATLEKPDERDNIVEKFVSTFLYFVNFCIKSKSPNIGIIFYWHFQFRKDSNLSSLVRNANS